MKRLLDRLVSTALKWFKQEKCNEDESVMPGTGQSAKDLAYGALLHMLNNDPEWRPKKPDEDPFPLLVTVMRHDFLDLVKKSEYKRTAVMSPYSDEETPEALDQLPDLKDSYVSAEAALLAQDLYPLVEGDQDLKDYIDAVLLLGIFKPEDVAEALGISDQERRNRQRKLKIRLATWKASVSSKKKGV
jgi:hypothetical protein